MQSKLLKIFNLGFFHTSKSLDSTYHCLHFYTSHTKIHIKFPLWDFNTTPGNTVHIFHIEQLTFSGGNAWRGIQKRRKQFVKLLCVSKSTPPFSTGENVSRPQSQRWQSKHTHLQTTTVCIPHTFTEVLCWLIPQSFENFPRFLVLMFVCCIFFSGCYFIALLGCPYGFYGVIFYLTKKTQKEKV